MRMATSLSARKPRMPKRASRLDVVDEPRLLTDWVDVISLDVARLQPARQPEAVAGWLRLRRPALQQLQQ